MASVALWLLSTVLIASGEEVERFKIYWNVPSKPCFSQISIPVKMSGIIANKGHEFRGERVTTFYEKDLGIYPKLNGTKAKIPINGGVPQKVNLQKHLRQVEGDINAAIPDPKYDGLAIIDYEEWRPSWVLNWNSKKSYREFSKAIVQKKNPSLKDKPHRVARKEFNVAAREYMLETIKLGKKLRPNAKWGFYGFPYCNYDAGSKKPYECSKPFQKFNSGVLKKLHQASDVLYPSIYFHNQSRNDDKNHGYIRAVLLEAQRVAAMFKPKKPVIAFTAMEYQHNPKNLFDLFYSTRDLCSSLRQPMNMGLDGLIFWSTSKDMAKRCTAMEKYVANDFGPYVKRLTTFFQTCSETKCSGHGICVLEEDKCDAEPQEKNYKCQCDDNWAGPSCSLKPDGAKPKGL